MKSSCSGRPAAEHPGSPRSCAAHQGGTHTRATGFIPFTGPARDSIAFAWREARRLGYDHWGPAHLLLGLASQDDSVAARALDRLGISQEDVRQKAAQMTGVDLQDQIEAKMAKNAARVYRRLPNGVLAKSPSEAD